MKFWSWKGQFLSVPLIKARMADLSTELNKRAPTLSAYSLAGIITCMQDTVDSNNRPSEKRTSSLQQTYSVLWIEITPLKSYKELGCSCFGRWSLVNWLHNWQDCESKACISKTVNTKWLFHSLTMITTCINFTFVRFTTTLNHLFHCS